jgi:hypothetical protein
MYEEIIEEIIPQIGERIKKEIRINCIYSDCPNPFKHLYFNTEKGIGFCHRCNRPTNIKNLIAYHKGVSFKEAELIINGTGQKKAEMLFSKIKKLSKDGLLKREEKEEDTFIQLPEGFIPFSSGDYIFPYLEKRKISYDISCNYGMGFCKEGRWRDRLIVPIFMESVLRGFVARSIYDPPADLSKTGKKIWSRMNRYIKVLNPKGFNSSRLIFNYDNIDEEMIITEGIFDALRCGKRGVALFGKHMSNFQEELIRRKKPRRVYIMLDNDAYEDAKGLAKRLAESCLNVYLVNLPFGDPGSFKETELKEYMRTATQVSPLKLVSLAERIKDVF